MNLSKASTDILLRRGQPAPAGVRMRTNWTWNNNLEFNPDGTTNEGGSTARMSLCDDRGRDYGRQIQVNPRGIPKLYSTPVPSCFP